LKEDPWEVGSSGKEEEGGWHLVLLLREINHL